MGKNRVINSEQYIDKNISETAGSVTYFRACSNKERKLKGPDYIAKEFHSGSAKLKLNLSPILLPLLKKYIPGTYEWVASRTFLFDKIFKEALTNNFNQIVIMGAGFDSRAYRFIDYIKATKIFEVDVAPTQEIKKKILKDKNINIPDEMQFVSVNFNKDNLGDRLFQSDFKKGKKNLFIWEGVTEYLTDDAVDSTLTFIKNNSMGGSLVAFTYIYREVIEGNYKYYGSKEIVNMVSKYGEPYCFGIHEGGINKFLKKRGFKVLKNYTPEELEKLYLTFSNGKPFGKISGHQCAVIAEVL
jgi:methyltransferase (TIGR00027 family)